MFSAWSEDVHVFLTLSVDFFSHSGPPGILGSDGKQNVA